MHREELYLDSRLLKTRKALMDSLLSLLMNRSFSDINITDIVRSAKVNRGSFYNHFSDKNDILNSLLSRMMTELIYAYKEPFLMNRPFIISSLPDSEVKLFNNIYKNAEFYTIILNSDVARILENSMFEAFKKVNIEELNVKNNIIRSDVIASYISSAIVGLIVQWVRDGYKYEASFMNKQLLELMKISPYKTFNTKLIEKNNKIHDINSL